MTYYWSQNQTATTFAISIYNLKETLKSAGWTVPSSSDGTTYNSSGDQITTGASGAGGLDNASAWFRIRVPSGSHEFCFQRNSSTGANTSRNWRIKHSRSALFTSGSPSATQTPSASDEAVIMGGGTDASPTFVQWQSQADNTYTTNCWADGSSPYGFYMFHVVTGFGYLSLGGHMVFEPVLSGTGTPTTDANPYWIYAPQSADFAASNFRWGWDSNTTCVLDQHNNGAVQCKSWSYLNNVWSQTGLFHLGYWNGNQNNLISVANGYGGGIASTTVPDAANTAKDLAMPIIIGRGAPAGGSAAGWKGIGNYTKMVLYGTRTQLTLATVSTTGDYIYVGPHNNASFSHFLLPWNNTVVAG